MKCRVVQSCIVMDGEAAVQHNRPGAVVEVDDAEANGLIALGKLEAVGDDSVDPVDPEVERPADDASKAEWVDYAASQGLDVDGCTKADIIAAFAS